MIDLELTLAYIGIVVIALWNSNVIDFVTATSFGLMLHTFVFITKRVHLIKEES